MTQPQMPVARLSTRVEKLEAQRVTYREATVVAVDTLASTFDADVAGAGRLDGIPTPVAFMPAVGDVVQLSLSGSVPIYQPARIAAGAVGTTELAGYVNANITTALGAANGKNKVTFSLVDPSGTGTAVGDPWFKRTSPAGVITGTWEWDGTAWQPRTYGDAVLSSLTVGKLVSGTGTFDLIIGGRIATAATGQRTELNPLGLQGFNSSNALTINIDGISNLMTGTMQTALTGRRIVMGASGSSGQISLIAPDGKQGFLLSRTESAGVEAVQLGMAVTGVTSNLWNRINYNSDEWSSYRANRHEFLFDTSLATGGYFSVYSTTNRGGTGSVTANRFQIDSAGTQIRDNASNLRFAVLDTRVAMYGTVVDQRLEFVPDATLSGILSPQVNFVSGINVAVSLYMQHDSGGANPRLMVANTARNAFLPIWASAFTVNSSGLGKTNRRAVPTDEGMSLVRATKVTEFNRLIPSEDGGDPTVSDVIELGVIAEELPDPLRVEGSPEQGSQWNLGPTMAAAISAIQNIDARLARLEKGGRS